MAFYSFGDVRKVLDLPLKTFWMLHKNIDRQEAERDLRTAQIAAQTQSAEGFKDLMQDLRAQMGQVVVFEADAQPEDQIDREGISRLRMLSTQRLGSRVGNSR